MDKAKFDEWFDGLPQKQESPAEAYRSNNARRFFSDGRAVVSLFPRMPLPPVIDAGDDITETCVPVYTYEKSRLVQDGILYWAAMCEGEEVDRWRA